jgi:hypothetical protein
MRASAAVKGEGAAEAEAAGAAKPPAGKSSKESSSRGCGDPARWNSARV